MATHASSQRSGLRMAAAVMALLLALAACGEGSTQQPAEATPTPTDAAPTLEPTATPPAEPSSLGVTPTPDQEASSPSEPEGAPDPAPTSPPTPSPQPTAQPTDGGGGADPLPPSPPALPIDMSTAVPANTPTPNASASCKPGRRDRRSSANGACVRFHPYANP